jgi:anti-anti-sigma regulatory factor
MDIRIDIETEGPVVVFHVSGRLDRPVVKQLTDACESIEDNFVLDLSDLFFADDAGIEALRTLRDHGADIQGAPSFIKLLMNGSARSAT